MLAHICELTLKSTAGRYGEAVAERMRVLRRQATHQIPARLV